MTEKPEDILGLSPQSRAARVAYVIYFRGRLTNEQIKDLTGIGSRSGIHRLMNNLSLGRVPVYQPEDGVWALLEREG